MNNVMNIFGFADPNEFHLDECHYFLDCLFRGLMKLTIPKKEKKPIYLGKKVPSNEIELLVAQIYPKDKTILERSKFIDAMNSNKDVTNIINYFHEALSKCVIGYRSKMMERL